MGLFGHKNRSVNADFIEGQAAVLGGDISGGMALFRKAWEEDHGIAKELFDFARKLHASGRIASESQAFREVGRAKIEAANAICNFLLQVAPQKGRELQTILR